MGKISSYGIANEPSLGDKLIGTSVGSIPVNGTFNFTLQQLLDLFIPLIPSDNLQQVLDAGNTAIQDITLDGNIELKDITINGVLKDSVGLAGTSGQLLSSTLTGTEWIDAPSGSVNIYNANGTLTGNRTVTMGSYTLSFTKDLIVNGLTIGKGLGNVISNTAIGNYNLSFNTSGAYNTALGYNALYSNTTGSNNTAIGASSLYHNIDGEFNISIGTGSLTANTSGSANISSGYQSLFKNTTGSANISSGYQSLYNNTIGSSNIAIGSGSLNSNSTGGDNVAIGESAGYSNGTGSQNTLIGNQADLLSANNTNSIVIGYGATGIGSNTVVLGNTSIVKTILRGTVNMANLPTSAAGLSAGDLWKNGTTVSIV